MSEHEKSSSIVTSYRLTQETKEKLQTQLKDLGMTQEQYFNRVVSLMELENVKKNNLFAVDAHELQELTQRIYTIFINLCEQGNSFLSNKEAELLENTSKYKSILAEKESIIQQHKQEIQDVCTRIGILQNENKEHKEEIFSIRQSYIKQLEQLESNLEDKNIIVSEYKQKNDDLLAIVSEHREYKEKVQSMQKALEDEVVLKAQIDIELKNTNQTILKLKEDIEKLQAQNKINLETQKDQLELIKNKTILELQQKHQQEINSIHKEYTTQIRDLLKPTQTKKIKNKEQPPEAEG